MKLETPNETIAIATIIHHDYPTAYLFKEEETKYGKGCSESKPDCSLMLLVVVIVMLVTSCQRCF